MTRMFIPTMRKNTIVAAILLAILCIILFAAGSTILDFRKYYDEAEPLVDEVWQLAHEMERYHSNHGTYPDDLDDVTSSSSDLDLSSLADYDSAFNTAEGHAFYLRVNDRYAFAISRDFVPSWVTPDQAGDSNPIPPRVE